MGEDKGAGRAFSGRRSAGDQEDWLRTKGKMLGFLTAVLAKGLRAQITKVPPQIQHYIFGYITPVAAEYVRRAIFREATLSNYEKIQLHSFTVRSYKDVIERYKGRLPVDTQQCIDDFMDAPIGLADSYFFDRMFRVKPFFDSYFHPDVRNQKFDDDQVFIFALLHQLVTMAREMEGAPKLNLDEKDATRMLEMAVSASETIRKLLSDHPAISN